MQPGSSESKKFVHSCPACSQKYRVTIQVKLYQIHKAVCPHCGNLNYFDNRNGALDDSVPAERKPLRAAPSLDAARSATPAPAVDRLTNASARSPAKTVRPAPRKPLFWSRSQAPGAKWLRLPSFLEMEPRRWLFIGGVIAAVPVLLLFALLVMPSVFLPEGGESYLADMGNLRENRILDRKGRLIGELFARKTGSMKAADIPQDLKSMIVFVEDESFYSHGGVHWPSIGRALITNITSFGYSQGGSTISQQLSRILLNTRQKTLFRKFRETSLAYYIESRMSKEEILTAYLNQVYLGHGAVGMDNAARFYFLRSPAELNFVQTLVLVCLPSAPEQYSPLRNPDRLERKMDAVFERMQDEGFGPAKGISLEQYQEMKSSVLWNPTRSPTETVFGSREDVAPYVAEHVRLKLASLFGQESQFGAGLTIETTIDRDLQNAANTVTPEYLAGAQKNFLPVRKGQRLSPEEALRRAIADEYFAGGLGAAIFGGPVSVSGNKTSDTTLQAAVVGVEPSTGAVLFMQGGRSFRRDNQINRAIQMRRQTGSAIKPIIYSAGIESGMITPATRLDDSPVFVLNGAQASREFWLPENITGEYQGKISARQAMAQSRNVPAILVGRSVGLPRLSKQFEKFFFQDESLMARRFRMDETVAIGSLEMSPLEMAVAFAAFADNGNVRRPFLISRIRDSSGKILYQNDGGQDEFQTGLAPVSSAIPGDVAEVMASMLRDSAHFSNAGVFGGSLLGKTGTTNDSRDTWFVGAVSGLAAAVWVGYDNPAYTIQGGMGARLAAPLFGRIVSRSGFAPGPGLSFSPRAERITVCRESGLLPGKKCPLVSELFASAGRPEGICDLEHGSRSGEEDLSRQTDFH